MAKVIGDLSISKLSTKLGSVHIDRINGFSDGRADHEYRRSCKPFQTDANQKGIILSGGM